MDSPAPLPPETEADLLQRAQAGGESAFGTLMQAHHAYVFRLVQAIVRHEQDSADICQEIWLTVWQKLGTFRGGAKFTTWLHPIATRKALDHLRKRRRWFDRFLPFSREDAVTDETERPDEAGEERREHLHRVLNALPPLHRTVLALREVQGLSYDEIAHATGIPTGTVMSRLYHARRLLAKKLKEKP
ncbi:MAG TPA: RNA polymerase sigma factor [Opitutaceae bacterium]|nr:RNA polymerase sigma factor [Opitutaceae bacterium]HRJ46456.1 RNA polymerase sigma factor [Opitutaceae bacterium]